MSARRVMTCYGLWMTALGAGAFALPSLHLYFWAAIGASSVVAVVVGVARYQPRRRFSWWFLAGGLAVFAAGDLVFNIGARTGNPPLLADILYLSVFPLVVGGYYGFTRASLTIRDRSRMLDLLVFAAAGAMVLWVFVVGPDLTSPAVNSFEKSTLAAYALGNLLVFAITVRLFATYQRTVSVVLLAVGSAGVFAADVFYGLTTLDGAYRNAGPIDIGWWVFYTAWGAAALHPSMTGLTAPVDARRGEIKTTWLALLGLATLVPPGALLVQAMTGEIRDASLIAVTSGVVFIVVLSRLTDSIFAHRHSVGRERGMRESVAALVSATDAGEVNRAVRAAVARLIPPDTGYRVVFAVHHSDGVPATAISIWGPTVVPPGSPHDARGAAAARRTRVLRVRMLHPALAEQLGGFECAVMCPLVLDSPAGGAPRVGALIVSAEAGVLDSLRDALEVLAGQAALALQRIALSDEVNRRQSEAYFRTLVQSTADVILIVGDDDSIKYASPSTAAVLGVDPADCTTLSAVIHPDDRAAVRQTLDLARSGQAPASEWTQWSLQHPGGSRVQVEVSCRDLRRDRTVRGLVVTMRDVTTRDRLERELSHRALHDALTGLPNRVLFHDRVREALAQAPEAGGEVAVLRVDLDDFTMINDTSGHAVGDELLTAVGQRIAAAVGERHTVARVGGDEFAAVVDGVADPVAAEQVAADVLAALAQPFRLSDTAVSVSASLGLATTADASDVDDLIRQADLALRLAKGAGKGRWRRYQAALHTAVLQRIEMRAALEQAVTDLNFTVAYQPIVAVESGDTVGFEALVRWRHPTLGLVSPDEFIDVAEESGLIEPIGDWVLQQAITAATTWPGTPYVSVNVSARQFRATCFVDKVRKALADEGLPPERLMLEITERLLLRDDEQVWLDLTGLREMGVRIAIDDFGTGFSSLSYLQQVPIDVLKIDKTFTATVASSARQQAIVDGIVRLAQTLSLEVVAEGIETEADRDLLRVIACPYGQGYLYSQPLAPDEVDGWLRFERDTASAEIAAITPS
ncbi:putative bifunctional diguanylate cyclase/phosphodiesterase [Phytohabitans kaempferiae]|uniref:Bifunctional diguanylate cyclase/phosphodiesterase n=1 Tax=Phytohabitans kaempferiae TaxID=1620943 RepID=A0ABV6M0M1_9ACTN